MAHRDTTKLTMIPNMNNSILKGKKNHCNICFLDLHRNQQKINKTQEVIHYSTHCDL